MSWQNTWGTVKATNAKACALYHEVSNVGKTIEGSKKRVTWRLKVEEGKEYEISLTHSLTSGKKVLRIDGIVKYTAKALSFGDWDYVFNLPGGHVVHIIIKPSVDLNDMYDLIIDGVSFRRLPDRLDPNRKPAADSQYVYKGEKASAQRYDGGRSGGSSSANSRESSFTPWECQSCTLVNQKPFAPVCEACGDPKPAYISPAAAARAKAAVEQRTPPRQQTKPQPKQADLLGSDTTFSPFGGEAANAFGGDPFAKSNGFSAPTTTNPPSSGFASSSFAAPPAKQDDIVSMLSGLDFATAPTAPTPTNNFADFSKGPASPNPADDSVNERTASGDLWDSKMVNLNLKPQQTTKATSVKHGPSMEQERQKTGSFNTKVPVMPLPVQAPVMMAPAPTQAYYGAPPMQQQSPVYYQQGGQFGTVGGYGGYNPTMGMAQQPVSQQSFMTAAQPAGAPKKPTFYGADPFATLS